MKINRNVIKELEPCNDRFSNYIKSYSDFDGSLKEFLALTEISYDDKMWVFIRLASSKQIIKWGALCAQSVLHIFELQYPDDKRPRNAVELVLENYIDDVDLESVRTSSYAAIDAARALYAANDTAHNAHVADAAAHAAAAACSIAYAAAYAAAFFEIRNAAYYEVRSTIHSSSHAAAYADDITKIEVNRALQQNKNLQFMLGAI